VNKKHQLNDKQLIKHQLNLKTLLENLLKAVKGGFSSAYSFIKDAHTYIHVVERSNVDTSCLVSCNSNEPNPPQSPCEIRHKEN